MGPLDSYLPYLLNRAGARIAAAFGEEMRPLGASLQIWRVLAALRESDGRRMGELSKTTSIEVSTLTRLVVPLLRSRTKMSCQPLLSPGTRLVASDAKTT